jgi:hypothetical protein
VLNLANFLVLPLIFAATMTLYRQTWRSKDSAGTGIVFYLYIFYSLSKGSVIPGLGTQCNQIRCMLAWKIFPLPLIHSHHPAQSTPSFRRFLVCFPS